MSVYKKISDDCRIFNSDSDFLKYYEKNKETIDEINTRALNLKYKINGFRIGRKEGKIILYPINNVVSKVNTDEDSDNNLKQEVEELKTRVNILENMINNLMQQYDALGTYCSLNNDQPVQLNKSNQQTTLPQKYNWSFK